jgi:hypothetical protein
MPVPRNDAVAALLLFLKPAFVPCTFLAGSNLAALPTFQLRPSIPDQGHAHQVLDTLCQPSCDLLPCRTCRRIAWMATASHATVDRQQLGRRLKGAGCRSRQGRRHPKPVTLSPSGTSTSRPSHRSLPFNAHHPFLVMPEHQLRDLGEPPFQAPISPSKCSMFCTNECSTHFFLFRAPTLVRPSRRCFPAGSRLRSVAVHPSTRRQAAGHYLT